VYITNYAAAAVILIYGGYIENGTGEDVESDLKYYRYL
jgi:hypothetical protein